MSSYILGLSVGLVFSIGLFFFIHAKCKKAGDYEYDERQMVGRGKAFQAAPKGWPEVRVVSMVKGRFSSLPVVRLYMTSHFAVTVQPSEMKAVSFARLAGSWVAFAAAVASSGSTVR